MVGWGCEIVRPTDPIRRGRHRDDGRRAHPQHPGPRRCRRDRDLRHERRPDRQGSGLPTLGGDPIAVFDDHRDLLDGRVRRRRGGHAEPHPHRRDARPARQRAARAGREAAVHDGGRLPAADRLSKPPSGRNGDLDGDSSTATCRPSPELVRRGRTRRGRRRRAWWRSASTGSRS